MFPMIGFTPAMMGFAGGGLPMGLISQSARLAIGEQTTDASFNICQDAVKKFSELAKLDKQA